MISISDISMFISRVISTGPKTTMNVGVGFFIYLGSHTVFVSNRHVIYPFDTLTIEGPDTDSVTIRSERYKCIPHKETDVDLAIVLVDKLKEDNPVFWSQIQRIILPESSIVSKDRMKRIQALQDIAAVTLLHDLRFDDIFPPVIRKGIVTTPVRITEDLLLTDLFCIKGNSGSPVFLLPFDENTPLLAGITRQAVNHEDTNAHLALCQNAYCILDFLKWI